MNIGYSMLKFKKCLAAVLFTLVLLVSVCFGTNYVYADETDAIELYQGNPQANVNFQCENMLPGDSVSQTFSVKVYHDKDLTLYFNENITDEIKNLGDVLELKVVDADTGEVICDSSFTQSDGIEYLKTLKANTQGETVVNFIIDAAVDTSVGNEYQGAALSADFKWYVNIDDQEGLTPPQTGEKPITVIYIILGVACVILITSVLIKRCKGDKKNG